MNEYPLSCNTNSNNLIKSKFINFKPLPFRQNQSEAVSFIHDSQSPITCIKAPTGFGKSLVGVLSGAKHDQFTYLVSSKQLQDQLENDFPELSIVKGRNNYPCLFQSDKTAENCINSKKIPCNQKDNCLYKKAKNKALYANYRCLNYHYFLTCTNFTGQFDKNNVIICDEADLLGDILTSFVSLKLSAYLLNYLDIPKPSKITPTAKNAIDIWIHWAEHIALKKIFSHKKNLETELSELIPENDDYDSLKKDIENLSGIVLKLQMFLDNVDETWIFEESKPLKHFGGRGNITFKPTWLTEKLSDEYFFNYGHKFVLISATFPPKSVLAADLGVDSDNIVIKEYSNNWKPESRPIILRGIADMSYKKFNDNIDRLLQEISDIMGDHLFDRGIIHSVSWKLNKIIMDMHNPRLLTHSSKNREKRINYFKSGEKDNGVLVSPSITRGCDFPDDECRFIIMPKCPYKSIADKLVSARLYSGRLGSLWYRSLAAQEILQGPGRGMRHENDYCKTYILDMNITNMIRKEAHLFSQYFLDAREV